MEAVTMCDAVLSRGSRRQGEGSATLPTNEMHNSVQVAVHKGHIYYKCMFISFRAQNQLTKLHSCDTLCP